MKTPRNCLECEFTNDCRSYYGSSSCKHKDKIYGQLSFDLDVDEDDYKHDYEEDGDEE